MDPDTQGVSDEGSRMSVIEVRDLTRRFGDFTAVDAVSFDVESGEVFGFLGPNGAGKSTTINMLCTLLKPSGGSAVIDGHDVAANQDAVRRSIGLIFQEPMLDERLTAWQNMRFHAMLYGVPDRMFETRAAELLDMVGLADKARCGVRTFSGGMKRRLEIALGLLHRPRVLFLDEPTIGLDPQTRGRIWEYLDAVRESDGLTVFLTTHYMDEAEVCDRIAIIDQGRIVACDSPEELKTSCGGDVVTLRTDDDERAVAVLASLGMPAERVDGTIRVRTDHGARVIPDIVRLMDSDGDVLRWERSGQGVTVTSADLKRPTLDDVFVQLTGRDIRDEGASEQETMRAMARMHAGAGR
jgi:ABC-2 type transport system ATP-binding protein